MQEKLIDVALLEVHPENEKIYGSVIADVDLIESLRDVGQLQPLLVTQKKENGKYRIIAGGRRFHGGQQLGWKTFRCWIKEYENDNEELVDLVHANRYREKTEQEKNAELLRLKKSLSALAELRKLEALSGSGSSLASKGANGRTKTQIAEAMGVSEKEVERRVLVHDMDYRNRFLHELLEKKLDTDSYYECNNRWSKISLQQNAGELSLTAAADAVKELQAEILSRCPGAKKRISDKAFKKDNNKNMHIKMKADAHGFAPWGRIGDTFVGLVLGDEQHIYIREGKKGPPATKVSIREVVDFAKCNVD